MKPSTRNVMPWQTLFFFFGFCVEHMSTTAFHHEFRLAYSFRHASLRRDEQLLRGRRARQGSRLLSLTGAIPDAID